MNISPLKSNTVPDVPIASLAANQHLTTSQKIAEASQQFEALLLKQFLAETQKPVIQSEFTDNSTAAGIYQDMISTQLAESLAKTDAIGLAKTFERQLDRQAGAVSHPTTGDKSVPSTSAPLKQTLTQCHE